MLVPTLHCSSEATGASAHHCCLQLFLFFFTKNISFLCDFIIGIYKLCSYNLTSFWPYLPVCVMLIQRQQRRSCNHSPRLGSLLTIRDKRQILWALPGLLSQILWTGERRDMSPVWRCRCECTLFDTMLTDICLISCVVYFILFFYSLVKWLDCISDVALMIYVYIYAFSRCFYPKRLTVHSGYTFCFSMCVPWESNPQPFALLTQSSATEPQEHMMSSE